MKYLFKKILILSSLLVTGCSLEEMQLEICHSQGWGITIFFWFTIYLWIIGANIKEPFARFFSILLSIVVFILVARDFC